MIKRLCIIGVCEYIVETPQLIPLLNKLSSSFPLRNVCALEKNKAHFCATFRDSKRIDEILQGYGAKICKKKSFGFEYLLSKYRKRIGIFAGLVLAAGIVFFSSLFVWEISVEGNEFVSDEEITALLESIGFHRGIRKKSVNLEKIINACLVADGKLSWMSINYDGTLAHVLVKEAKTAEEKTRRENVNIVASRDGVIVRVDALGGEATVEKGETVTKGEMLICAFLSKRTGGNILHGARGFVWAMTQRRYFVSVPLEYKEKMYTGKSHTRYEITFFGKCISVPLGKLIKSTNTFDYSSKQTQISLFNNGKIPLFCKSITQNEYIPNIKRRTVAGALEIARNETSELLKNNSPGFVEVSRDEKYEICDGTLEYVCTFDGIENIAQELEFEIG